MDPAMIPTSPGERGQPSRHAWDRRGVTRKPISLMTRLLFGKARMEASTETAEWARVEWKRTARPPVWGTSRGRETGEEGGERECEWEKSPGNPMRKVGANRTETQAEEAPAPTDRATGQVTRKAVGPQKRAAEAGSAGAHPPWKVTVSRPDRAEAKASSLPDLAAEKLGRRAVRSG